MTRSPYIARLYFQTRSRRQTERVFFREGHTALAGFATPLRRFKIHIDDLDELRPHGVEKTLLATLVEALQRPQKIVAGLQPGGVPRVATCHIDAHAASKTEVTFEVLLASFGLDGDAGLARLGALVHFLDVGGIPVPEAPGFAAIVSGARALQADDDGLLQQLSPVLNSLYRTYSGPEA